MYPYRLTLTFQSTRQWRLGVETKRIGEQVARELTYLNSDVAHVCLSTEKTGKVHWLRMGKEFQQ